MSVLDTFTYIFKAKDEGVQDTLENIEKGGKNIGKQNELLKKSFADLGNETEATLNKLIPGMDRVIGGLKRVGAAIRDARQAAAAAPGGGGRINLPGKPGGVAVGGAGEAGAAAGASATVAALAVAAAAAAIAVGTLASAFVNATNELANSRRLAQEAGVNATQMAASEMFAMSKGLSKTQGQEMLAKLAETAKADWMKRREYGNIFGIGTEQGTLLRRAGISTADSSGKLKNASVLMDELTKKMIALPKETAIGLGTAAGMSRDFAEAIAAGKVSLNEFAVANASEVAERARAIEYSKQYEVAQQKLSNAWDEFSIKVGAKFLPTITKVVEKLSEGADVAQGFYNEWSKIFTDLMTMVEGLGRAVKNAVETASKTLFGDKIGGMISSGINKAATIAGKAATFQYDAASALGGNAWEYYRQAGQAAVDPKDAAKVADEMKKSSSLNEKAARLQLDAANAMKTAVARFGLSTEQYMALWAGDAGKAGGMNGRGVTTADFRDITRMANTQYAGDVDQAAAAYGIRAPMMTHLPNQYLMDMQAGPTYLPRNPRGLDQAKRAVNETSINFPSGNKGGTNVTVTTGDIHVTAKGADPNEVNRVIGEGLTDQLKVAANKTLTGRLA